MKIQTVFSLVLMAFSALATAVSHAETESLPKDIKPFAFLALNPETIDGIRKIPTTSKPLSANEKHLMLVINTLERGDLFKATRLAQALTSKAPRYALAHLVYADLLRLQISQDFTPWSDDPLASNLRFIDQSLSHDLPALKARRLEMSLRLKALQQIPIQGMVPKHIWGLGTHYQQLVVADTQLGRLNIFDIRHNTKPPKLHLKHSFFLTIGEQGPGKQVEGDKKTPLGIYQLLDRVPQEILTDLYGTGALNINYPNPIDRKMGRTGYGIWFHGSPSDTYVRHPLSSDGCLVLSNDDMNAMLSAATPQQTLVIIDDGVEWLAASEWTNKSRSNTHPAQQQLSALIGGLNLDSPEFNSTAFYDGGSKWEYRLLRLVQSNKKMTKAIRVTNVTMIEWTRDTPYVMLEFDFQLNAESAAQRVRQYWMNQEDGWKIVRESTL